MRFTRLPPPTAAFHRFSPLLTTRATVQAHLSSECSIVCLIYVERLMEKGKVPLTAQTWRPILLCGLLLASKVWQDYASWNIEFSHVYPQVRLGVCVRRLSVILVAMARLRDPYLPFSPSPSLSILPSYVLPLFLSRVCCVGIPHLIS